MFNQKEGENMKKSFVLLIILLTGSMSINVLSVRGKPGNGSKKQPVYKKKRMLGKGKMGGASKSDTRKLPEGKKRYRICLGVGDQFDRLYAETTGMHLRIRQIEIQIEKSKEMIVQQEFSKKIGGNPGSGFLKSEMSYKKKEKEEQEAELVRLQEEIQEAIAAEGGELAVLRGELEIKQREHNLKKEELKKEARELDALYQSMKEQGKNLSAKDIARWMKIKKLLSKRRMQKGMEQ